MMLKFSGIIKRIISLIMIALLAVVFCGSIDLTCDSFSSGAGIKGSSSISVSHSLIAFPSAAVREGSNGVKGNDQTLEKESTVFCIFSRIAKKLLYILSCDFSQGSNNFLKHYFISICIAGCTCLFLLTHVRFIHLKDGSK